MYNACSSECFGDTGTALADESTPFRPQSPYATAKAAAYWSTANYRSAYGIWCCSGILFNHDSPLRPERFVTKKIVAAACRIAAGRGEKGFLGKVDGERGLGWAPEDVDEMWRLLQQPPPGGFVIATREKHFLQKII